MSKFHSALILLIILSIIVIFYVLSFFNESNSEHIFIDNVHGQKFVTKVIDGDTIIVEGGYSVRLLGIDADERGYVCYKQAKYRLEQLVLNKYVYLESDKENRDIYDRYLRFLIFDNENINVKLIKEGFVVARLSDENMKYAADITEAEKYARENKIGCKWKNIYYSQDIEGKYTWNNMIDNAVNACDARKHIGKEMIIQGKIMHIHKSKNNNVFFNFGGSNKNQCFTVVVFHYDLINFPVNFQNDYKGKVVRVSGTIKEYNGIPEIVISPESQIEIGNPIL